MKRRQLLAPFLFFNMENFSSSFFKPVFKVNTKKRRTRSQKSLSTKLKLSGSRDFMPGSIKFVGEKKMQKETLILRGKIGEYSLVTNLTSWLTSHFIIWHKHLDMGASTRYDSLSYYLHNPAYQAYQTNLY